MFVVVCYNKPAKYMCLFSLQDFEFLEQTND